MSSMAYQTERVQHKGEMKSETLIDEGENECRSRLRLLIGFETFLLR